MQASSNITQRRRETGCSASTILSGTDNHLGRFEAAGVSVCTAVTK